MSTGCHKVGLVVDPAFGERIAELATSFHIWVVESSINTPVVHRFWKMNSSRPQDDPLDSGITSFKAREGETGQEMCTRIAADVAQHHGKFSHDPPWTEIAVFGVALNQRLRELFMELGALDLEATQDGFICRRG